jgi:Transposase IS66 family/IS66 C-terminal element
VAEEALEAGASVARVARRPNERVGLPYLPCLPGARRALPQVRHRGCDPLCAIALECPRPLRRRRTLEIDNNAAERALRFVALGRKNFLFAGSDADGERAAAIYSLLGSTKLNGRDPEIYLQHVLERIAYHPVTKINGLLHWLIEERKSHNCVST